MAARDNQLASITRRELFQSGGMGIGAFALASLMGEDGQYAHLFTLQAAGYK